MPAAGPGSKLPNKRLPRARANRDRDGNPLEVKPRSTSRSSKPTTETVAEARTVRSDHKPSTPLSRPTGLVKQESSDGYKVAEEGLLPLNASLSTSLIASLSPNLLSSWSRRLAPSDASRIGAQKAPLAQSSATEAPVLANDIYSSTVPTFHQAYAALSPWLLGGVVIAGTGIVVWHRPDLVLEVAWYCTVAAVGHVVFSMLHWMYYDNAQTNESAIFKILGHEIVVRQCENDEPGLKTNVAINICRFIAHVTPTGFYRLTRGEELNNAHDQLIQTPVTQYIKEASMNTPVRVKKVRFDDQGLGHRVKDRKPRYHIPRSCGDLLEIPKDRVPSSSPADSGMILRNVGLLFSNVGLFDDMPSPSTEHRTLLLRIQIIQAKLREIDDVTGGLFALVLDLTTEAGTAQQVLVAKIRDETVLHDLVYRCAKLLYSKRDAPLLDAWWHEATYPTHLNNVDLQELTDWTKLCLSKLSATRSRIQLILDELNGVLMQTRLKDKMKRLPRGRKERMEEAKRPKPRMTKQELDMVGIGIVIKGGAQGKGTYSVAGDLAGFVERLSKG